MHEIKKLCANKPRQGMKTQSICNNQWQKKGRKALCKQAALDKAANGIK